MRGRRLAGDYLVLALLAAAAPAAAQQIVIDDFATAQGPHTVNPGPGSLSSGVVSVTSVGGGRALRVSASAGGNMTAQVSGGQLSFTRAAGIAGTAETWWDGNADANFDFGLAADFTAGGQDRFRVTVASATSGVLNMRLVVWTDGGNSSQRNFTLPTGGGTVDLLYSSFSVAGGTGANFANVGNIELLVENVAGDWSGVIDELRTTPVELMSFSAE